MDVSSIQPTNDSAQLASKRLPIDQLFALQGRTAICTGATGGIGKELCVTLAEAGCDIVSIQLPLDPAGTSLEHEIKSFGRSFRAFECDIGDSCEVRKCFSRIWDAQIEPDILLNAAGINKRGKVTELTDADIDSVSRVPVVGDSLDEYICSHAPRSSPSTSKEATSPPRKWQNVSYHCRSPARSSTSDL
jgi:NAD(P)-dependent dehydrogenase (short-subunit alcohol dehydrogenase family)